MSLKAKFPILVVMKYSSLHSTFFSVKSKVKPPVVINGAPKNLTALPTTAIRKEFFKSINDKENTLKNYTVSPILYVRIII